MPKVTLCGCLRTPTVRPAWDEDESVGSAASSSERNSSQRTSRLQQLSAQSSAASSLYDWDGMAHPTRGHKSVVLPAPSAAEVAELRRPSVRDRLSSSVTAVRRTLSNIPTMVRQQLVRFRQPEEDAEDAPSPVTTGTGIKSEIASPHSAASDTYSRQYSRESTPSKSILKRKDGSRPTSRQGLTVDATSRPLGTPGTSASGASEKAGVQPTVGMPSGNVPPPVLPVATCDTTHMHQPPSPAAAPWPQLLPLSPNFAARFAAGMPATHSPLPPLRSANNEALFHPLPSLR